jgi:hypothetical protein
MLVTGAGDRSAAAFSGSLADFADTSQGLATATLSDLAIVTVVVVSILLATRLTHGAAGDRVLGIDAVDAAGNPLSRPKVVLNAALPMLVWLLVPFQMSSSVGFLVVAMLWAPALFRADRRSVFAMLTGTHFRVEVPVKHVELA